ncbi:GCN5 family acetyltransferase [Pontibacillus yanchengensis Y32]|uniref:GCN5 family acetyltransferase n=1 Tax=Pontibacillus yanchengensis Y32 TaxID=1385514 RepID=A0A0A2T5L8_9BACI|nr:GCN5 family acetyltransferase [Pontibacillus yanchengensis Y32]
MNLSLLNYYPITIRQYCSSDFPSIQLLNTQEGWHSHPSRKGDVKLAWEHSNIAYVATYHDELIGYIRGFTDHYISLFISELIISKEYRGLGLGKELLDYVHCLYPKTRIEMLATSSSKTFYEQLGYRSFYGFRKNFNE